MLSDIGVVQTTDESYARTLQGASDSAWMKSINEQYARDRGLEIEQVERDGEPDGTGYHYRLKEYETSVNVVEEEEPQSSTEDCRCDLQVRGKKGDSLSPEDPLKHPDGSTTLGPGELPDRWGYKIEITGTVPDDASTYTISQDYKVHLVLQEHNSNNGANYRSVINRESSEPLSGPRVASQPKGGHRFFAIDGPGIPSNSSTIISGHVAVNFTTKLSKNNVVLRQVDWSIVMTVVHRKITEAHFYPQHVPLK